MNSLKYSFLTISENNTIKFRARFWLYRCVRPTNNNSDIWPFPPNKSKQYHGVRKLWCCGSHSNNITRMLNSRPHLLQHHNFVTPSQIKNSHIMQILF